MDDVIVADSDPNDVILITVLSKWRQPFVVRRSEENCAILLCANLQTEMKIKPDDDIDQADESL